MISRTQERIKQFSVGKVLRCRRNHQHTIEASFVKYWCECRRHEVGVGLQTAAGLQSDLQSVT